MTKKTAIEDAKKFLHLYGVAAILRKSKSNFSYVTTKECVNYQQAYFPQRVVKILRYSPNPSK